MDGAWAVSVQRRKFIPRRRGLRQAIGAARPKRVHACLRALASLSFQLGAPRGGHFFFHRPRFNGRRVIYARPRARSPFSSRGRRDRSRTHTRTYVHINAERLCGNSRSLTRLVSNLERVMATSNEDTEDTLEPGDFSDLIRTV